MINVPKIFTQGVRVPAGEYAGNLALPCPCGELVDLDGDRELHLAKLANGYLCFFHTGCAISPGE